MDYNILLLAKQDLEKYTTSELYTLARHRNIDARSINDLCWLLCLDIYNDMRITHKKMPTDSFICSSSYDFPQAAEECMLLLKYEPDCDKNGIIKNLKEIECYINSTYIPSDKNLPTYLDKKFANGDTFVIKEFLQELNEYIVIKATNLHKVEGDINTSFDENIHEAFIGLYAINNLRKIIPNFVYTFGMFNDKCVFQPDYSCNYLITEYIPGKPLSKFIKNSNVTQFVEILLQVCLSLKLAGELYDFTHYDLHSGNLIIQELDHKIDISYDSESINTQLVAVFIDFGSTHVKLDDINYGRDLQDYNIHNKFFWEHDIVKLLCHAYSRIDPQMIKNRLQDKLVSAEEYRDYWIENNTYDPDDSDDSRDSDDERENNENRAQYNQEFEKAEQKYKQSLDKVAMLESNPKVMKVRQTIINLLSFFKENITPEEISSFKDTYFVPKWLTPSRDITQFIKFVKDF